MTTRPKKPYTTEGIPANILTIKDTICLIFDGATLDRYTAVKNPTGTPKIIAPAQNPDADAWKYGYRNYGLCDTYENKAAGIYVHKKA